MAGEPRPGAGRGTGWRTGLDLIRRNFKLPCEGSAAGSPIGTSGGNAPVPEAWAWVGRSVELVFVSGVSTEYSDGNLQQVNDRGIVLPVETHVGHPSQLLFSRGVP